MSNGQTLERQVITKFAQELLTFLRQRPGVALESLAHSTPEMSFDLGKARKNQVIHNRAGDRIFVTELTGTAYIRFNSPTGSRYRLRLAPISSPFQKLYLENEAQAGKTVSIIIGYGPFVDFAVSYYDVLTTIVGKDFATQATLALIKAKTDNLTDLASQTTLALIKAKTDKLNVNLSTVATQATLALIKAKTDNLTDLASQTTLALIKAKTDKLNVNLSTVATQATLALMKTKIDNTFTEVQKLSTPVSDHDTSTGAALTLSLEVGHRRFVEVYMKTSAAATFKLYGSKDNVNWRQCDEIEFDGAGELKNGYWNADKYVKVSTTDANNNEIEITAS